MLGNDTDADTDAGDLTAVGATQPDNGEVTLDADGSFTYTPDAGFTGVDTFTYRASDGENESAPATVTVVVAPPPAADVPPIHYTLDEGTGSAAGNTGYDTSFGDADSRAPPAGSRTASSGRAWTCLAAPPRPTATSSCPTTSIGT